MTTPLASFRWRSILLIVVGALISAGQTGCYNDCGLKIKTDALPSGTIGVDYRFNLDSGCGGDDWFISDGTLPPGIQLQSDGDLRGVPTATGTFNFTIGVFDFSNGDAAFKGFQITIFGPLAPTPTATVGPQS